MSRYSFFKLNFKADKNKEQMKLAQRTVLDHPAKHHQHLSLLNSCGMKAFFVTSDTLNHNLKSTSNEEFADKRLSLFYCFCDEDTCLLGIILVVPYYKQTPSNHIVGRHYAKKVPWLKKCLLKSHFWL